MNIYELTGEYENLLTRYDMAEDEIEREQILAQLDAINDDIGYKGEAYARIIQNKKAEAKALRKEAKRLVAKADAADAVAVHLKDTLMNAMQMVGTNVLVTPIGKWRISHAGWSVKIPDETLIPAEYRIHQPDKIDKKAIRDHFLQTGEIVNGVDMVQPEYIAFR